MGSTKPDDVPPEMSAPRRAAWRAVGHDGAVMVRLAAALVSVALVAAACGGDDNLDPEAFCELIREGKAIEASNQATQIQEFDLLIEVAPDEISDAVQQLANTTRGLRNIDELDQLFEAAFDPDAQAARTDFNDYAVTICGYEGDALADGQVTSSTDPLNDLRAFIDQRFSTDMWRAKVRFDPESGPTGTAVTDVEVTFIIEPGDGEALEACEAVAIWAFELQEVTGEVRVLHDDLVLVSSTGPGDTCVTV
jgi:hypothetical protein